MRHQTLDFADAEIDRRLAEQHRQQLAVDVGDVDQRDVADGVEAQQFGLREPLLRKGARPAGRNQRRGRGCKLKEIAP